MLLFVRSSIYTYVQDCKLLGAHYNFYKCQNIPLSLSLKYMFVTLVLVFVSGSFLLWRILRTTLCDHYHMTHTAPRALSLQNY